MKRRKRSLKTLIRETVRRIVKAAEPEKIILFGSAAHGKGGPHSDLDFLVVKSCSNRRETARIIRRNLIGVDIPIDILVATPEDIRRYGETIGLIYRPALREGRVMYAA
ncbi:MAG: nucleotidyltransferase domain-containing protein [Elusimicrobia bacterium]|nr:nucleotidyltransferase domain-containing protein [Elusimicrobiota bacterium]